MGSEHRSAYSYCEAHNEVATDMQEKENCDDGAASSGNKEQSSQEEGVIVLSRKHDGNTNSPVGTHVDCWSAADHRSGHSEKVSNIGESKPNGPRQYDKPHVQEEWAAREGKQAVDEKHGEEAVTQSITGWHLR
ncbi:hypothetical protein Pmar_PMAR007666, partial [Perkinsus marinus ATCC 50983]